MDEGEGIETGLTWRSLVEAVPGAVGVQRGDRFAYVSEKFAAAVGVERDALAGEPWRTLFDPRQATLLERTAVERAGADGTWNGAVQTGGDGVENVAVDLTLSAVDEDVLLWIVGERGPHARASPDEGLSEGFSSTDGDQSERSTRAFPAFVQALFDAVDDVLYVIDESGEFYLWNDALAKTTGYSHEEIGGMHPLDFVPEDQHEYVPGLMDAIDTIEDRRVEVDILAKDGERVTHEFTGTTFEDPRTGAVYRCGLARDVTDRKERQRELERYETITETIEDGVYALNADLEFTFVNDALCEMAELPREEALGMGALDLFPDEDDAAAAAAVRDRVVAGDGNTGSMEGTLPTSDGNRRMESRFRLYPEADGEFRGSVGVIRDVTERERRERALERQRDELATLDRINELLLETVRELIASASREAVERTVCERLAASDLYQFAWVGERELDGDRIVPRTSAGEGRGYLDAVAITADESGTGAGPVGRAIRTGEVQVADVADPGFEPWRDAAVERGFQSVAAVPLGHDDSVDGVLVVYATRENAFSPREQAGFDVLGRTVGLVVQAARSRDLLFADAVVELEFRVADADSVFVAAAAELGCELTLDGYVASGDRWICYVGVDGASPATVVATASSDDRVERARVVSDDGDAGRIEVVIAELSLLHAITAAGATLREASADADDARLVVEAPATVDTRTIVERVRDRYPTAELVARHERDREVTTVGRPGGVLDALTERQREALETAYRAGYFDWPRASTAEAVADALDVAPATLHGHLRKAERAILSALLDDRQPDSDGS